MMMIDWEDRIKQINAFQIVSGDSLMEESLEQSPVGDKREEHNLILKVAGAILRQIRLA